MTSKPKHIPALKKFEHYTQARAEALAQFISGKEKLIEVPNKPGSFVRLRPPSGASEAEFICAELVLMIGFFLEDTSVAMENTQTQIEQTVGFQIRQVESLRAPMKEFTDLWTRLQKLEGTFEKEH